MKSETLKTCPELQVLQDYTVRDGRIVSPGKFEGEPVFAPYFWELGLEGFADRDDGKTYTFKFSFKQTGNGVQEPFRIELRQWLGSKRTLKLWEDSQGFVHCV